MSLSIKKKIFHFHFLYILAKITKPGKEAFADLYISEATMTKRAAVADNKRDIPVKTATMAASKKTGEKKSREK